MQDSARNSYNHIKIHTQYSICEGAVKIDQLKDYCKSNKIKSLGLCDKSQWQKSVIKVSDKSQW